MKTLKKSALALAIATAMPFAAQAADKTESLDTFISAAYTTTNFNGAGGSREPGSDFRLSTAYTHSSGFGGQFDAVRSNLKLGSSGGASASVATTDFAGHFYFRNELGLIGAFGQRRTFDLNVNTPVPSYDLSLDASFDVYVKDRTFMGLEGQVYFGDLTVAAQGGKQVLNSPLVDSVSNAKIDGNFFNIDARYFIQDNLKVVARLDFNKLSGAFLGGGNKARVIGIGAEYRLADTPVSVFVNFDNMHNDYGSGSFTTNRFMVGAKMNFGSKSLKARDRDGASLNPVGTDNTLLGIMNNPT